MINSIKAFVIAAAIAVAAVLPGTAKATLIGDEVTLQIIDDVFGASELFTETVGGGVEFDVFGDLTADVGASSIEVAVTDSDLDFQNNVALVFTDLDWIGENGVIVDVVLTAVQGVGGVSFTEDSVTFVIEGGAFVTPGALASIEIITRHASVPEPGTLALLGLGLTGLVLARRRWRKTAD